jgi:hypothetical protein
MAGVFFCCVVLCFSSLPFSHSKRDWYHSLLTLTNMLTINTRYERVSPTGDRSVISINSEDELFYHTQLAGCGFKYTELRVSAPVDSACFACE